MFWRECVVTPCYRDASPPHLGHWKRKGVSAVHDGANRNSELLEGVAAEDRFRTTVYLTEGDITALDELRAHFRRREKRQVDRSQLIREAIRRYHEGLLAR